MTFAIPICNVLSCGTCPKNKHRHVFTHDSATHCKQCGIPLVEAIEAASNNRAQKEAASKAEWALRERLAKRAEEKALKEA